jgi:protein involved in temperature-dependent protein secretion
MAAPAGTSPRRFADLVFDPREVTVADGQTLI